MLDNQKIQSHWPEIKIQVLNKWNKLSEADVEETHGDSVALSKLVESQYNSIKDFDNIYEKICNSYDIANFDARSPSGEAGLHERTTEDSFDNTMDSDSPERRLNANYAKVEHPANFNREADDELSAYTPSSSHLNIGDFEETIETQSNSEKADIQFTTPDEFYPSQDPSPSREDITLGRNTSSATKLSTAKAAPISSEVSNDAKRKS